MHLKNCLRIIVQISSGQTRVLISNRFRKFLSDKNIELYHVFNEGKAVIVEMFNRTLGEMMQKHLTASNTSRYIDVLQKLIEVYNTRYHSSIKMAPFQASNPENREQVLRNLYSDIKSVKSHSLKPATESEYTGINARSKKGISLIGLKKYL